MTIDTLGSVSSLPAARLDRGHAGDVAAPGVGRAAEAAIGSKPATASVPAAAAGDATGSKDELEDAVGKLNESVHAQSLEFSIDEDSKRTIVKVVDVATKEVLRQMPSEEALRIAKSLDKAAGLLIRQQA